MCGENPEERSDGASWQCGSGDVVECRARSSVGVRGLAFSRAYAGKTSDPRLFARDALDLAVRGGRLFCDVRAGRLRDAHVETLSRPAEQPDAVVHQNDAAAPQYDQKPLTGPMQPRRWCGTQPADTPVCTGARAGGPFEGTA